MTSITYVEGLKMLKYHPVRAVKLQEWQIECIIDISTPGTSRLDNSTQSMVSQVIHEARP